MATQGIERIPDSLGFLVLTDEGAVISSGGDLENDESSANIITKLVYGASKINFLADSRATFKRLSVISGAAMFAITVSNHKIYVSKRKYSPEEPVTA